MILQRYIISEILKPAAAILAVLVIIFASYCAVTYLAQAVSTGQAGSPARCGTGRPSTASCARRAPPPR